MEKKPWREKLLPKKNRDIFVGQPVYIFSACISTVCATSKSLWSANVGWCSWSVFYNLGFIREDLSHINVDKNFA